MLFTVHTYRDRLRDIAANRASRPALKVLAATIRSQPEHKMTYRGLDDEAYRNRLLKYLDSI